MPLRLKNQNDPGVTLSLTTETWFGLLNLAEEHGWVPLGTVLPDHWAGFNQELGEYYFDIPETGAERENGHRFVLLEDALNLADALEKAFMELEPTYVPASYFYFEPLDEANHRPSLGALVAAQDFCSLGAFWIEHYRRLP